MQRRRITQIYSAANFHYQADFLLFSSISFRVMSFIEKSVARLDQQDRLEALAVELGKSHYHYNAPPKYYSVRPQ